MRLELNENNADVFLFFPLFFFFFDFKVYRQSRSRSVANTFFSFFLVSGFKVYHQSRSCSVAYWHMYNAILSRCTPLRYIKIIKGNLGVLPTSVLRIHIRGR